MSAGNEYEKKQSIFGGEENKCDVNNTMIRIGSHGAGSVISVVAVSAATLDSLLIVQYYGDAMLRKSKSCHRIEIYIAIPHILTHRNEYSSIECTAHSKVVWFPHEQNFLGHFSTVIWLFGHSGRK